MKANEVKLFYATTMSAEEREKVTSSADAERVLGPYFEEYMEHREVAYIIILNRANAVLGVSEMGKGGVSSCIVDTKLVMQTCLLANASGFILAHNHPSGKREFSEADKRMNANLKKAGEIMDIKLLDSLIIIKGNYMSAADEGVL